MKTKNLLSLHEAIAVALINLDKDNFTSTYQEIADYIEERNLYSERKGNISLAEQVMLRSTKAQGSYSYLFESVNDTTIRLRR